MFRISLSALSSLLGLGSLGFGGAAAMSTSLGRLILVVGIVLLVVFSTVQWIAMLRRTSAAAQDLSLRYDTLPARHPTRLAAMPTRTISPEKAIRVMEPIRPCSVSCLPKRKTEKWLAH